MKLRDIAIIFMLLFTTGCAVVQPWQRDTLSEQHMQVRTVPEAAQYAEELQRITEGTSFSGGASAIGGGCGCN